MLGPDGLGSMNKRYLIALATFIIGAGAARFVEPSRLLAPMLAPPPGYGHGAATPLKVANKPQARAEKIAPLAQAAAPEGDSNERVTMQRKSRNRDSVEPTPARKLEPEPAEISEISAEVQKLLHEPIPQGKILTHEQSDDGTTVDRATFATGELKGESWQLPTGEHIQRAFYQSGQIEGVSWVQPDGTSLVVKLKSNGLYAGQREEHSNGEKIVTKYDDEGRVSEKWQIRPDGQRQKIL